MDDIQVVIYVIIFIIYLISNLGGSKKKKKTVPVKRPKKQVAQAQTSSQPTLSNNPYLEKLLDEIKDKERKSKNEGRQSVFDPNAVDEEFKPISESHPVKQPASFASYSRKQDKKGQGLEGVMKNRNTLQQAFILSELFKKKY